jgi:hypothetical protein
MGDSSNARTCIVSEEPEFLIYGTTLVVHNVSSNMVDIVQFVIE